MSTVGGKAKRFSRPAALGNASDIINPHREIGTPVQLIPLDKLDMDADNIRPILLNTDNPEEIDEASPLAARMREQLEEVRGLARSIETSGLLNPVEVYRRADRYVLATGQRRYLAHRLLALPMIRASILMTRPKNLRTQQYIENDQRKDMSLAERVKGLGPVFEEANIHESPFQAQWDYMKEAMGMSKTTSYRYLVVHHAPGDVREAVFDGRLTNLEAAVKLANTSDPVERARALHAVLNNEPTDAEADAGDAEATAGEGTAQSVNALPVKRGAGRPTTKVALGSIEQPSVVRGIIRDLLGDEHVPDIDWSDLKAASKAFQACLPEIAKRYA